MRFLRADKVFNGEDHLPGHPLLVLDARGTLLDILQGQEVDEGRIEKLEGVITPGFINAHCHLELSHLLGKTEQHTGLPNFGKQVITQRNAISNEEAAEHAKSANAAMWRNGIVAVGDISNGDSSFGEKAGSNIFYHTFIELIGLNPAASETIFNQGLALSETLSDFNLRGSLAPHAPYSTSKQLIGQIAAYNFGNGTPFSIHNQESAEEDKFFMGEKNGFEALYGFLNLDISWFKAPGCSSFKSYADGLSPGNSILVHNTVTRESDLAHAASKNIYWCFCPNANLYIEDALPHFDIFKDRKRLIIGTDSLASNEQLDLVSEANTILNATSIFSSEELLGCMTKNGARALGIDQEFGSLLIGKNAGLNLIALENKKIKFLKKII
ncbi:MAG: amidohydrolase family protein [Bacteroidota bacterium]